MVDILPWEMFNEIFGFFSMRESFIFSLVSKSWYTKEAWHKLYRIDDDSPGFDRVVPFLVARSALFRGVRCVNLSDVYLAPIDQLLLGDLLLKIAPQLEEIHVERKTLTLDAYSKLFSKIAPSKITSILISNMDLTCLQQDWHNLMRLEIHLGNMHPEFIQILSSQTGNIRFLTAWIDPSINTSGATLKTTPNFAALPKLIDANPGLQLLNIRLPQTIPDPLGCVFPSSSVDLSDLNLHCFTTFGIPMSKLRIDSEDVFCILFASSFYKMTPAIVSDVYDSIFADAPQRNRLQALAIAAIRLSFIGSASEEYSEIMSPIVDWMDTKAEIETEPVDMVETKFAAIVALQMIKLHKSWNRASGSSKWIERFKLLLRKSGWVTSEMAKEMVLHQSSREILEDILQDDSFCEATSFDRAVAQSLVDDS